MVWICHYSNAAAATAARAGLGCWRVRAPTSGAGCASSAGGAGSAAGGDAAAGRRCRSAGAGLVVGREAGYGSAVNSSREAGQQGGRTSGSYSAGTPRGNSSSSRVRDTCNSDRTSASTGSNTLNDGCGPPSVASAPPTLRELLEAARRPFWHAQPLYSPPRDQPRLRQG